MPYKNKEENRNYQRQWARDNKERLAEQKASNKHSRIKRNKEYVNEYKQRHPCVDCGETDIKVLDFDHVRGTKRFNLADAVWSGYSVSAIRDEIYKCEIRCKPCHGRVTAERKTQESWQSQAECVGLENRRC